jgi:hypothetical protein
MDVLIKITADLLDGLGVNTIDVVVFFLYFQAGGFAWVILLTFFVIWGFIWVFGPKGGRTF